MAQIYLGIFRCEKTQEAIDEPFIKIFIDGGLTQENRGQWDCISINDGDVKTIGRTCDFNENVRIEVWEKDRKRNDFIGEFTINHTNNVISQQSQSVSGRNARYSILYSINALHSHEEDEKYDVEIVSLVCHDAQESKDEPFMVVNGFRVSFDSAKGQTGWESFPYQRPCIFEVSPFAEIKIELWESDTKYRNLETPFMHIPLPDIQRASDHFGTFVISPETAQQWVEEPDVIRQQRFRIDKGIIGDADYTVNFKLKRHQN